MSEIGLRPPPSGGCAFWGLGMRWGGSGLRGFRVALLASTCVCLGALPASAVDSVWVGTTADWNTQTNWNPDAGADGVSANDTATFTNNGAVTAITTSVDSQPDAITFTAGAPAYTITLGQNMSIGGNGIVNNSGVEQNFIVTIGRVLFLSETGGGPGATTLTSNAGGSIYFRGDNTAAQTRIISNGLLLVQRGVASGANVGSLEGSGQVRFDVNGGFTNQSLIVGALNTNTEYSGTMSQQNGATGSFEKVGTGTFINSGTSSYTGGTTISAGTYQLGSGGTAGSLAGNVLNNATFTINRSDNYAFDGVISGSGAFNQSGTGITTLGGISTYTGATTVSAGTLWINGTILNSSGVTVANGATLGGTGTAAPVTVNTGGTLAPGNSIGVLNVSGGVTFNAGTTYAVEASPTDADRTNATGNATLTGGTVAATFGAGTYNARTYTILSSAGLGGTTFAGLTTAGLPSGFSASLSYTATDAILNLTAMLGLGQGPFNVNQQNVASTINTYYNGGGTLPQGFLDLFDLSGGALGNALTQLTGENATGASTAAFAATGGFLGLMMDPFAAGRSNGVGVGSVAFAAEPKPALPEAALAFADAVKAPRMVAADRLWSVWGGGYGGSANVNGNAATGSQDINTRTYGIAAGADYRPTPSTVLGFALAGGGTNWGLAQGLGGGNSDVFQLGGYATHSFGAAYVSAAAAYAWHSVTTDRTVTVGGTTEILRADFNAQALGGRLEGGYRFATPAVGLTPYAALQVQRYSSPDYSEYAVSGPGTFALTIASDKATATRVELGAWFDKSFMLEGGSQLALRARAAYAHDDNDGTVVNAAFQTLPGSAFTVNGAAAPENLALLSAAAEVRLASNVTLAARFDGEFGDGSESYAGRGSIRYAW